MVESPCEIGWVAILTDNDADRTQPIAGGRSPGPCKLKNTPRRSST